ncbi:MAG: hypothetical protein VKJ04_09370 [Vampirovibrionales bacterium]|nr:hypothetical protein [Vampirovibrionales bacterium]
MPSKPLLTGFALLLILIGIVFSAPRSFAQTNPQLPPLNSPPQISPNQAAPEESNADKFGATVLRSDKSSLLPDPAVEKLEAILQRPVTAMDLPRGPLEIPPVYLSYLSKVNAMSEGLLALKERFDKQMAVLPNKETPPQLVLSLQELGAMSQKLSADNRRFKSQFEYGENDYQSYRFIEQAVSSLEDATTYWRLSNRYRSLYRAEAREKSEDDELLTIKLQTALNAIESLKNIQLMRERLKKLDADTYP